MLYIYIYSELLYVAWKNIYIIGNNYNRKCRFCFFTLKISKQLATHIYIFFKPMFQVFLLIQWRVAGDPVWDNWPTACTATSQKMFRGHRTAHFQRQQSHSCHGVCWKGESQLPKDHNSSWRSWFGRKVAVSGKLNNCSTFLLLLLLLHCFTVAKKLIVRIENVTLFKTHSLISAFL